MSKAPYAEFLDREQFGVGDLRFGPDNVSQQRGALGRICSFLGENTQFPLLAAVFEDDPDMPGFVDGSRINRRNSRKS